MVIEDLSALSHSHSESQKINFASVQDRFLAFAFDLLIVFPFVYLINFPLFKKMKMIEVFVPGAPEYSVYFFLAITMSILFAIFYQTYFTNRYSATLGQMFFKLKVVNEKGERPYVTQSLIRSLLWWLSCFLAFLPFLEVVSHRKRKALHDRGSETFVITQKKKRDLLPLNIESSFVRSFVLSCFIFFSILSLTSLNQIYLKAEQNLFTENEATEQGILCADIEAAPGERVGEALALYLAQVVDRSCLETETQFELSKVQPNLHSQMASIALSSQDSQLLAKYSEEYCQKNIQAEACAFAEALKAQNQKDLQVLQAQVSKLREQSSLYFKVWLSQSLYELAEYEKSNALLKDILNHPKLSLYAYSQRVKNLTRMGDLAQAKGLMFAVEGLAQESSYNELVKWMADQAMGQQRVPASSIEAVKQK